MTMTPINISELHRQNDVITAVPAGATQEVTIDLPAGYYYLLLYGTQIAATTAPTLALEIFVDSGQTDQAAVLGALFDDAAPAAAVTLDVAKTAIAAQFVQTPALAAGGASPVYVPHGLKMTYTKNGGTAINLSLAAQRVA